MDEKNEKVLLILREDFRIWALPGGGLEAGGTPEQAALREAYEESGFEVKIDKYIGKYYRPQFRDTRFVYRASVSGGKALESGSETVAVNWFSIDSLPKRLAPSVREIIRDMLSNGNEPFEKVQIISWWKATLISSMVKLRNLRNWLIGRK